MTKGKDTLYTAALVLAASGIFAVGFNWCFIPNRISCGGITGLAQIITVLIPGLPLGMTVICLNLPLFLLGWRLLGGRFLLGSLYAMTISSLLVDAVAMAWTFQPMEPLLACLYGGLIMGLSIGLMLRQGVTTGGTDLAARLLKLRWGHLPIGQLCLILDVTVVVSYALVFRDLDRALCSLAALYTASLVMDRVVRGGDSAKMAFIISDRYQEIAQALMGLDRGVTLLHGAGAYSGRDKEVLYCVCKRNQIVRLKRTVKELDPSAFLVVSEAREVLGEGFNRYREDAL